MPTIYGSKLILQRLYRSLELIVVTQLIISLTRKNLGIQML